ncbi:hypothetical protein, partial [Sulfitobacter sp.]|uniref:hypothetical protein n=1 Tax=Sulfitobacter sp. TaxID=1903071 RepID=UPI0030028D33
VRVGYILARCPILPDHFTGPDKRGGGLAEAITVPVGNTTAIIKIDVFPFTPKIGGRVCN